MYHQIKCPNRGIQATLIFWIDVTFCYQFTIFLGKHLSEEKQQSQGTVWKRTLLITSNIRGFLSKSIKKYPYTVLSIFFFHCIFTEKKIISLTAKEIYLFPEKWFFKISSNKKLLLHTFDHSIFFQSTGIFLFSHQCFKWHIKFNF